MFTKAGLVPCFFGGNLWHFHHLVSKLINPDWTKQWFVLEGSKFRQIQIPLDSGSHGSKLGSRLFFFSGGGGGHKKEYDDISQVKNSEATYIV